MLLSALCAVSLQAAASLVLTNGQWWHDGRFVRVATTVQRNGRRAIGTAIAPLERYRQSRPGLGERARDYSGLERQCNRKKRLVASDQRLVGADCVGERRSRLVLTANR